MEMRKKNAERASSHVMGAAAREIKSRRDLKMKALLRAETWRSRRAMASCREEKMSLSSIRNATFLASYHCAHDSRAVVQIGERLYEELSAAGALEARFNLAILHLQGDHTRVDLDRGYQLMLSVAQSDFAELEKHSPGLAGLAACAVGDCHAEGRGTPKSEQKALEFYELSAQRGCPHGAFNAGAMYHMPGELEEGAHSDGQVFKKMGYGGASGFDEDLAGDLVITLEMESSEFHYFSRPFKDSDELILTCTARVSLWDWITGGDLYVPTLDGVTKVEMRPRQQAFTIPNQGWTRRDAEGNITRAGLRVNIEVIDPPAIDDETKKMLKQLRAQHKDDELTKWEKRMQKWAAGDTQSRFNAAKPATRGRKKKSQD